MRRKKKKSQTLLFYWKSPIGKEKKKRIYEDKEKYKKVYNPEEGRYEHDFNDSYMQTG